MRCVTAIWGVTALRERDKKQQVQKEPGRVSERVQWAKVLAAKAGDVSSSPETHMVTKRINSYNLSSGPWVNTLDW